MTSKFDDLRKSHIQSLDVKPQLSLPCPCLFRRLVRLISNMQNLRTSVPNYYQTLGVTSDASPEQIKKEFRSLARRYHPDLNPGDKVAEERFKQINEAYDILSDEKKRQQYDVQLFGTSRRRFTRTRNGNSDFISNLWQDLKNQGNPSTKPKPPRTRPKTNTDYSPGNTKRIKSVPQARDIEAKLTLPLSKAYEGGRERIRLEDGRSLEVDMPAGMYNGQKIRLKGQGIQGGDLYLKIFIEEHPFFQLEGVDISCEIPITPSEAIVGGAIEVPTIDGLVKMNVPAGVKSGQRLKLANKGYPNSRGQRGDQLVIIKVLIPTKVSEAEKQLYQQIREIEQFNPRQKLINFYQ